MDDNVTCHIDGLEDNSAIAEHAQKLIEMLRAAGKPVGVIWVEYFTHDDTAQAQVHYLDTDSAEVVKEHQPELKKRSDPHGEANRLARLNLGRVGTGNDRCDIQIPDIGVSFAALEMFANTVLAGSGPVIVCPSMAHHVCVQRGT